jgi:hypothetical protein
MEYIIYNPKRYNGKPTPDIKTFAWAGGQWDGLPSNTMARYPEHVGVELLKRYGFLQQVMPEDIENITNMMGQPEFICEYCNEELGSETALATHILRKHKLSAEAEVKMAAIPVAKAREAGKSQKQIDSEAAEGIPDTKKGEKDGWYGPGLENDMPESMETKRPGSAGEFGG